MTLEELTSALVAQTYVAAEGWYYLMTGLMIAIHVGFLMYDDVLSKIKSGGTSWEDDVPYQVVKAIKFFELFGYENKVIGK